MHEQSKAAKRRIRDPDFMSRYFVGHGLDIGAGEDGLGRWQFAFPLIDSVRHFDKADGDAQTLAGIEGHPFDFIHASHVLEHMPDPYLALRCWLSVLRQEGYLVVTVPDEDMYEHGHWPSLFSHEHKWTFTIGKYHSWSPVSINLIDLATKVCAYAETERMIIHREFFDGSASWRVDQTLITNVECSIEWVLRKR